MTNLKLPADTTNLVIDPLSSHLRPSLLDQVGDVTREDLEALSVDHARVLAALMGGLSYEAISTGLNIPLGTVRSRLNRAREQIIKNRATALAAKGGA